MCLVLKEKRERQKRRRCAVQTPHLHVTPIPNFSLPPTDADDNDDAKRRRLVCAQPTTTLPILFTLSYRWLGELSQLCFCPVVGLIRAPVPNPTRVCVLLARAVASASDAVKLFFFFFFFFSILLQSKSLLETTSAPVHFCQ